MSGEDPLSEILSLVQARSAVAGGLEAGGDWSLQFPVPDRLKFFIAARGSCWLIPEDEPPRRLAQGDVFLLVTPRRFRLASDPALQPIPVETLYADGPRPLIRLGPTADFYLLGGHVDLDASTGRLLLASLPPAIHIGGGSPEAAELQWLTERLVRERYAGLPGSRQAVSQLAELIFLHILRGHLAAGGPSPAGRLRAVGDPRIAPALRLMHAEPGRPWHLADLARACAMSRSVFAEYFKSVAGVAPLGYLTEWRMRLAERALREIGATVAALSASLGYASESAFSTAFKRVTGFAPTRYRRTGPSPRPEPASLGV